MFNRKEEKIVPGKHVIDEDMLTSDEQNKKLSNKQKLKKAKRSKRNTEEKCKVCDNKTMSGFVGIVVTVWMKKDQTDE